MERELLKAEKNKTFDDILNKAYGFVAKAVNEKRTMSQEEVADLRIDIDSISFVIANDILAAVGEEMLFWEIEMEGLEGSEFAKYYKAYMQKYTNQKANYTKSSVESFARKTLRMKGKPYSEAKILYLAARNYKDKIYQLLKSLHSLSNSLSKLLS